MLDKNKNTEIRYTEKEKEEDTEAEAEEDITSCSEPPSADSEPSGSFVHSAARFSSSQTFTMASVSSLQYASRFRLAFSCSSDAIYWISGNTLMASAPLWIPSSSW